MDFYPKYLSKEKRLLHYILTLIIVLGAIFYNVLGYRFGAILTIDIGIFKFDFSYIFGIIIGGLLGDFWIMLVTVVVFICNCFYNLDSSYYTFIILLTAMITNKFMKSKAKIKISSTIIYSMIASLICGNLWVGLLTIMGEMQTDSSLLSQIIVFLATFPEFLILYMGYYALCNYAPDKYKELFYMTHYYTEKSKANGGYVQTRLSKKVTTSLSILISIILISSLIMMNRLFDNNILEADVYPIYIKLVLMIMCIAIPFISLYSFMMRMSTLYPIVRMSKYMQQFSNTTDETRGDYAKGIDELLPNAKDEIKDLYDSLKMLVTDVTMYINRVKEEQRLKEALEVAKSANEAKSVFLSNVSHEIRTPINAVLGMDEMILRETDEPQIAEYANNIKTASNTLLSIINDVLDFSKIESGKMEIVPIEYELYGMINDLTTMIEDRARKKNLEFKLNINKDIPHILFGDELRIKQCILNILTNAVKYTEKGYFSLSINYRIEDNHNIILIIKVTDTGQGIKQEDIERLFVPFERIDEARNRTVEGTGLGMSIVQNLLYKMDSKLEVKSEYGKGSTFSFRIKQEVISWEPIGNFEDEFKKSMTETGSYHELFQAPDAKILFVDDTDMNHTVIKGLLKNTRIKIDSLMSGEEALEAVKKTKYDIIFLDHRMPGLDGVETLKAMNEMEDNINKAVPCIALTANVVSGAKEKYLSCGFADYMSKPVDSRKLEEMILALLPKEKIFIIKSNNENKDNMSDPNLTDKAFNDFLKYVPSDMDMNMALKNCGDIKTFTQVLVDFRKSAENRIEEIEDFYNEKNLSDYGIRVHALKSTARILGEKELSQRAEELENFANNNDYQSVEKNHKALIKCFNSTLIGIDFLMSHFDSDDTMRSKEIITEKRFREAEKGLYNLIENYDFDGADGIMEMLSEYDIPLSLKDRYNKIKKMMASVDRDGLMELLSDN